MRGSVGRIFVFCILLAAPASMARDFYVDFTTSGSAPCGADDCNSEGNACSWVWIRDNCSGQYQSGGPHTFKLIHGTYNRTSHAEDVNDTTAFENLNNNQSSDEDDYVFWYVPSGTNCDAPCTVEPVTMFDTTYIRYPEEVRFTDVPERVERTWDVKFTDGRSAPNDIGTSGFILKDGGWIIRGIEMDHMHMCFGLGGGNTGLAEEFMVEYNKCVVHSAADNSNHIYTRGILRGSGGDDITGDSAAFYLTYNWFTTRGPYDVLRDPWNAAFGAGAATINLFYIEGIEAEGNYIFQNGTGVTMGEGLPFLSNKKTEDVHWNRNRIVHGQGHGWNIGAVYDGTDADGNGMLLENLVWTGDTTGRCLTTSGDYTTFTEQECTTDSECPSCTGGSNCCWEEAAFCGKQENGIGPTNGVCGSHYKITGTCSDIEYDERCGTITSGRCNSNPYKFCTPPTGGGYCVFAQVGGTTWQDRSYYTSPTCTSDDSACVSAGASVRRADISTEASCTSNGGTWSSNRCYLCHAGTNVDNECMSQEADENTGDVCRRGHRLVELKNARSILMRNNTILGAGYTHDVFIQDANDAGRNSDTIERACHSIPKNQFGDSYDVNPFNGVSAEDGFCTTSSDPHGEDNMSCTSSSCPYSCRTSLCADPENCGNGEGDCSTGRYCHRACFIDGFMFTNNIMGDNASEGGTHWVQFTTHGNSGDAWTHVDEFYMDGNVYVTGVRSGDNVHDADDEDFMGNHIIGGEGSTPDATGRIVSSFITSSADNDNKAECCQESGSSGRCRTGPLIFYNEHCDYDESPDSCATGMCPNASPNNETVFYGASWFGETQCSASDDNLSGSDEGRCSNDSTIGCEVGDNTPCGAGTCNADGNAGCVWYRDIEGQVVNYSWGDYQPLTSAPFYGMGLSDDRSWRGRTLCASEDYYGNTRSTARCTPGAIEGGPPTGTPVATPEALMRGINAARGAEQR